MNCDLDPRANAVKDRIRVGLHATLDDMNKRIERLSRLGCNVSSFETTLADYRQRINAVFEAPMDTSEAKKQFHASAHALIEDLGKLIDKMNAAAGALAPKLVINH